MMRLTKLLAGTCILGSGIYGFAYWQSAKNAAKYYKNLEFIKVQPPQFTSDEISQKLETGDYLFINFDYSQCISAVDYLKCWWDNLYKIPMQFDSIGVSYKSNSSVYILYNQFGRSRIMKYEEFVALPYVREMVVQVNKRDWESRRKLDEYLGAYVRNQDTKSVKQRPYDLANKVEYAVQGQQAEVVVDLKQLIKSDKQIIVRVTKDLGNGEGRKSFVYK